MPKMLLAPKSGRFLSVFVMFGLALMLGACAPIGSAPDSSGAASETPSDSPAPSADSAASTEGSEDVHVGVSSPLLARVEFDELARQSSLIVRGTVSDEADLLRIQGVHGGDPAYYLNTYFDVAEVYRGEAGEASIPIREECMAYFEGEDGSLAGLLPSSTTLEHGKEYILFLYAPNYGGGWNTADDYFEIVGFNQGAFLHDEEEPGVFRNVSYEQSISAEAFAPEMAAFNEANPIDYDYYKHQLEEGLAENLESGFITEEQYNEAVENRALYATILSSSEPFWAPPEWLDGELPDGLTGVSVSN